MRQSEHRRSRTLLVVYALFGTGALVLLAAVAALLWFSRSEDGKKLIDLAERSYEVALQNQAGPAADALRDLGCASAIVTSTADFGDALPRVFDAEAGPDVPVVVCMVALFEPATIGCDAVAERFLSATHEDPEIFFVSVASAGNAGAECQSLYDKHGRPIDTAAAGDLLSGSLGEAEDPVSLFGDPSGSVVGRPSAAPDSE